MLRAVATQKMNAMAFKRRVQKLTERNVVHRVAKKLPSRKCTKLEVK